MATEANKKSGESWREVVVTVVQVVLLVLVVRTFILEPFNIPSGSMIPTLLIGDYVFVSKWSYGYGPYSFPFWHPPIHGRIFGSLPHRGDVVVFRKPTDPDENYIKRIVGLPGDKLQVLDGVLYVNGKRVELTRIDDYVGPDRKDWGGPEGDEPEPVPQFMETLPPDSPNKPGKRHVIIQLCFEQPNCPMGNLDNTPVYLVPPDHVFGMGDNRDNSTDSRVLSEVGYIPIENLVGKAQFRFYSFDPSVAWWEVWRWPFAIRYSRLFTRVN